MAEFDFSKLDLSGLAGLVPVEKPTEAAKKDDAPDLFGLVGEYVAKLERRLDALARPARGPYTTALNGIAQATYSDPVDCTGYNALHVDVLVSGTTPSATLTILGGAEMGGIYRPLPSPNASQAITASASFDVVVGAGWVKIQVSDVTGSFAAGQGYTVIVTPFVAAGPERVQVAPGSAHVGQVGIDQVQAGALVKGITATVVTCAVANTDYPAAAAMPAGTRYLAIYANADIVVAMGEATSATKGLGVAAGGPTVLPVSVTGVAADDTVHVQSGLAGAVVRVSYLAG